MPQAAVLAWRGDAAHEVHALDALVRVEGVVVRDADRDALVVLPLGRQHVVPVARAAVDAAFVWNFISVIIRPGRGSQRLMLI